MRILFIRHGEPDYAKDDLTDTGVRQAELLSQRLKDEGIEEIWSSPLGRAQRTARISSEVLKLPYVSEVDGKQHTYITDFYMKCQDVNGKVDKYIIEVKPESQSAKLDENNELIYPKPPKQKTQRSIRRWQEKCNVIRTNNSKWKAARRWCAEHGYIFKVLTERQILNMCK